ncbi:hypothetical protein BKA62DRAFT_368140 [Auriculariales sp. MPI-PUGE-AT-0066]|nr:hypothetical protein BKA62DRAFT_368140 [Auriculariales sp. MPI-PUGE-AT-0066]
MAALAFAHVDVESLLWEMRDLLRGFSQINKAQTAELERLGGSLSHVELAAEYDQRATAAAHAVDAALDQLESRSDDGYSAVSFDAGVAAWVQQANAELAMESAPEPSTPAKDEPMDFWNTQSFKWDEEPEDALPAAPVFAGFVDPVFDTWTPAAEDDELLPSDSVTERADDDEEDSESDYYVDDEEEEQHSSSNDDSATLFYPTPAAADADDDSAVLRAVERHAYMTGSKARALVKAAGFRLQHDTDSYMFAKSDAPRPVAFGRPRAASIPVAPQAVSVAAF